MNIQTVFAHNMRELRLNRGLTQEQLSEKCQLHRTYIGGIEQRRVNVSLKNIAKIADALDVNPAYFFMNLDAEAQDTDPNPHQSANAVSLSTTDASTEETTYFLCTQTGTDMSLHPIEVENVDVALQILALLIEQGYNPKDLAQRYQKTKTGLLKYFYYEDEASQSPS